MEVASDRLGLLGSLFPEVAAAVRKEERKREREREREGGENLASSPHASLNRPTRLVAESHQSWGNT